jgi:hypothetical protein
VTIEGKMHADALTDAIGMAEGYTTKAKEAITKAASALTELHVHMFPKEGVPKTLGDLADVYCAEPSTLVEYSHTQTMCGSQITLALATAHEVLKADLRGQQ